MRSIAICGLVVLVASGQFGCGVPADEDRHFSVTANAPDPTYQQATVQYIVENPAAYAGREVTVTADVVDVWSPQAFTLAGRQFAGNPTLLVITPRPVPEFRDGTAGGSNPRGLPVRVRGVVRVDTIDAIEREYDIDVASAVQSLGQVKGPILLAEHIVFSTDSR